MNIEEAPMTTPTTRIVYSSCNSHGVYRLNDDHWLRLEAAGWTVHYERDITGNERHLGALAARATGYFPTVEAARENFERVLGLSTDVAGCECCGPPHIFYVL